jgi:membrane fusion protein, copper/silver efflux system
MRRTTTRPMLLVVGVFLLACAGGVSTAGAAGPGASPTEGTPKKRKILYWRSPMDPTFISKHPGKDAMGMDLVPVYAGEQPKGPVGMVRIDPATVQDIGVKTTVVRRKKLTHDIRTVGRVTYDESKVRRISPKVGGWIERQHVSYPGQVVAAGEPLLEIYSRCPASPTWPAPAAS